MAERMDIDDHQANEVNDGRLVKMEIDYMPIVNEAIPAAQALAIGGNLTGALDKLYTLEKQTRLGHDMRSNCRLLEEMVQLCYNAKNWQLLCDTAQALAKKRSLIKAAVARMVKLCCTFVNTAPDIAEKLQLIDALRTITEGKIYVEVERARLTKQLVEYKEKKGEIEEAATLLLDLQVETFGSMELKEKVEFLLEQMRLTLVREDYVRTSIIAKKISTKFFDKEDEEVQKMKLRYYNAMVTLNVHNSNYLEVAKHYRHIADTPLVRKSVVELRNAIQCAVLYILLTEHSNEQWDALQRFERSEDMTVTPKYRELIKLFTCELLISWPRLITKDYERLLRRGTSNYEATNVFSLDATGNKRWESFETRIGEHNIRMLAKYYTQIELSRMAAMLDWSEEKTEQFFSTLVTSGVIPEARLNRITGIIHFHKELHPHLVLDNWSYDLHQLTDSINKVAHLIEKEEMVHKYLHGDCKH